MGGVPWVGDVERQAEPLDLVIFRHSIERLAYPGDTAIIEFGVEDAKAKAQAAKAGTMIETDGLLRSIT